MSSDNNNPNDAVRQRRGSVGGLASMFRSNSISQPGFPGPISTAMNNDRGRRLSISTVGLGSSPTTSFSARRASMSTNGSDAIDENAVEEDDGVGARTAPTTPFTRRMSFGAQAMRNMRAPPGGTSPGSTNGRPSPPLRRASTARHSPPSPPSASVNNGNTWNKISCQASSMNSSRAGTDTYPPSARSDQGFNWSEQLRSRAESNAAVGPRPSFSFASGMNASPPRGNTLGHVSFHDRAKSVSDMPVPPAQAPKPRQPQKPDPIQERILKGDFYMD